MMNAMGDDFGIGLGRELIAERDQFITQLFVIFDDAVVNDRDAVARDVRMRVALRGHAVSGPARVCDAEVARSRRFGDGVLQHLHLADRAHSAQLARASEHRDSGRVVAAILEAAQTFDQDGYDVTISNGADDSTHGFWALGCKFLG